jgi:hypothetical protein
MRRKMKRIFGIIGAITLVLALVFSVIPVTAATGPAIKVTAPNGGELIEPDVAYSITWSYSGSIYKQVDILLEVFSGDIKMSELLIGAGINRSLKNYDWLPKNMSAELTGDGYKILIREANGSANALSDESDAIFKFVKGANAAGSIATNEELVIGPINIIKLYDVERFAVDQNPSIGALIPGNYIARVNYRITNLSDKSLYFSQGYWMETNSGEPFPINIRYYLLGKGGPTAINDIIVEGKQTAHFMVEFGTSIWAKPVTGANLHIYPLSPYEPNGDGKG